MGDEPQQGEEEKVRTGKALRCAVCGKPSPDTICDHCKTLVRAEALEKKRKAEKAKE